MAGPGSGGSGDNPQAGGKGDPPPETPDAIGAIVGAFGPDTGPATTPPSFTNPPPTDDLPDGVVPIAGDSDEPPPPDVVPIAGDSPDPEPPPQQQPAPPPPQQPPPAEQIHLPSFDRPNPFVDDDDDGPDDTHSPWLTPWKIIAILLVAVAATAISFFVFTSGGSKSPVSAPATEPTTEPATTAAAATPPAAQSCPPPTVAAHLKVDVAGHESSRECVGPAQYKSDPKNKYYSYFAWETMLDGRQVQIVVTGGHLKMPVTSKVSPNTGAVSESGTKLADVDIYDNASGTKSFAESGSVTLNPSGAVKFADVKVKFRDMPVTLSGTLPPN